MSEINIWHVPCRHLWVELVAKFLHTGLELWGWQVSPAGFTHPLATHLVLYFLWPLDKIIKGSLREQWFHWKLPSSSSSIQIQCLAPAIGNFSMLNSIWLCLSDSRDFTSQLMLGTRDKRILQIFLVKGLTNAPARSISNKVFENYLSGVRNSSLNDLLTVWN